MEEYEPDNRQTYLHLLGGGKKKKKFLMEMSGFEGTGIAGFQ